MTHIITATAFKRKPELGGGFRAAVLDKRTKERYSEILPTIEAARFWAKTKTLELLAGQPYAPGYSYKPDWVMNVFIR